MHLSPQVNLVYFFRVRSGIPLFPLLRSSSQTRAYRKAEPTRRDCTYKYNFRVRTLVVGCWPCLGHTRPHTHPWHFTLTFLSGCVKGKHLDDRTLFKEGGNIQEPVESVCCKGCLSLYLRRTLLCVSQICIIWLYLRTVSVRLLRKRCNSWTFKFSISLLSALDKNTLALCFQHQTNMIFIGVLILSWGISVCSNFT